jgi:HrpA-like RNA helicase
MKSFLTFCVGKSTLLPALLVAEGYDKVIVTQPRRLPCKLISKRVNETMITNTNASAEKLAGWAVSGEAENSQAKILYLTDGLFKERLLNEDNFLPINIPVKKSIVFFIDEVHERSVNIDLCLALIARILTEQRALRNKIKVIISSATLDSSVAKLFSQIPQINFFEFTIPTMGTLYPVTKFDRPHENILNIVQELYKKRQRHDQILCFVNSASEVNQCCHLLSQISQGSIVAYPLIQSQSSFVQQTYIENGSVFFSTTVAETSLTFPSLKYVVDTGMINIPIYDMNDQRTILTEIRAAESTIKQRLGRLGRTKSGEYYALYDFDPKLKPFPTPQICQSDLISIEFSLRKSPLQDGLNYLKNFLPDKPEQPAIDFAISELTQMGKSTW